MPEMELYHGSPKPVGRFVSGHRRTVDEQQQLNFGVHLAEEACIALRYGRFLHRCRMRYSKMFDATAVDRWDKLPEGHAEVLYEILRRTKTLSREGREFLLRQEYAATNYIERGSNKLVQETLRKHGFDAVAYMANITMETGRGRAKAYQHPAYIGLVPENVEVLVIGEMPKKEWNAWVNAGCPPSVPAVGDYHVLGQ